MTFGLSSAGFLRKRLEDLKSEIEADFQTEFGTINIDPESVFGQIIGILAKENADLWEDLEEVYYSQYPNSAEGVALDNVSQLIGIIRLPATYSRVVAVLEGNEGTLIPAGTLARQTGSNYNFTNVTDGLITRSNANFIEIQINILGASTDYTITIDGTPYVVNSGLVPNATTLLSDLATAIGTSSLNVDYYATVTNPGVSISVTATDSEQPFNLIVSSNLKITRVQSPFIFQASTTGAIPIPINTLTNKVSAIFGWTSINNLKAGTLGSDIETDEELRLRRLRSFFIGGYATPESIRAHLLQDVSGVTNVIIYENRTMKQDDLIFSISANLQAGDTIDVIIDGIALGSIAYNTYGTQLGAMNAIAALIATAEGVTSATVSGSPYHSITVVFDSGYQLTVNDLIIQRGVDSIPFTESGGRPPKSYEAIVDGGTDEDVANNIWLTKPAGIETFGNTQFNITDSSGNQQAIFFSRPIPVYIWVSIAVTLNPEEELPTNWEDVVIENILAYGETLNIGMDVIQQRVLCKVVDVPGIGSAIVALYGTTDSLYTPVGGDYVLTNISIAQTELAEFASSRIIIL